MILYFASWTALLLFLGIALFARGPKKQLLRRSALAGVLLAFLLAIFQKSPTETEETFSTSPSGSGPPDSPQTPDITITHFDYSSTASTQASHGAMLDLRRIRMRVEGDHPLLHLIAARLGPQITALPGVEEVAVENEPLQGEPMPSLFLTLLLPALEEQTNGRERQIEITAAYRLNRHINDGPSHMIDEYSPPLVGIDLEGTIKQWTQIYGDDPGDTTYERQAEEVATRIATKLEEKVTEWREDFPLAPPHVDGMTGSYQEPPLPLIREWSKAELLAAGPDILANNRMILRLITADARPTREILTGWHASLTADGWQGEFNSSRPHEMRHFYMRRDHEQLYVFREREKSKNGGIEMEDVASPEERPPFYIRYTHYMDRDAIHALCDRLLADETVPLRFLLSMKDRMARFDDLTARLGERVKDAAVSIPDTDEWLMLAGYYQERNDMEEARSALQRARAASYRQFDSSRIDRQVETLSRKLNIEEPTIKNLSLSQFTAAGFVPVEVSPNRTLTITREPHQPLMLLWRDPEPNSGQDPSPRLLTLTLTWTDEGEPTTGEIVDRRKNSWTRQTQRLQPPAIPGDSFTHTFYGPKEQSFLTQIHLDETGTVTYRIEGLTPAQDIPSADDYIPQF